MGNEVTGVAGVADVAIDRIKQLERAVLKLHVELEVRTNHPGFPFIPEVYRQRGLHSAWTSGYESGWRGRPYSNPYDRSKQVNAYLDGYNKGDTAAEAEINVQLRSQKAILDSAGKVQQEFSVPCCDVCGDYICGGAGCAK